MCTGAVLWTQSADRRRYRVESRELQLKDWLRRPIAEKVFDNLARLTASLQ